MLGPMYLINTAAPYNLLPSDYSAASSTSLLVISRESSIGFLIDRLRRLPLLEEHAEILDTTRNTLLQLLTCTMIENDRSDSAVGL